VAEWWTEYKAWQKAWRKRPLTIIPHWQIPSIRGGGCTPVAQLTGRPGWGGREGLGITRLKREARRLAGRRHNEQYALAA
jgi:hypothetical protein